MNKPKLTPMEALKAIGNLLKMDFAKNEKFKSAKLEDGTEVMWDGEIAEGTAIMVVAEDGNQMPAPDATHVLEDGTKVTTVGGLVTMIEPKVVEVETQEQVAAKMKAMFEKFAVEPTADLQTLSTMMKAVMQYCFGYEMQNESRQQAVTEAINVYKSSFATVLKVVEEQEEKFAKINETIENTTKNVNEKFDAIKVIVNDIADSPIVGTPKPTNITFKKKSVKSAAERIAEIKNSNK
jgi:hypothetical protein